MTRYRHIPAALALLLAVAACGNRDLASTSATTGVRQTTFPGQITAGGGSSGAVMARTARPEADGTYAGGTPGIAGGSGGTTGGAATAGTVVEAGQGPSSGTAPVTEAAPAGAGQGAGATGAVPPAGPSPRGGTGPVSGDIPTAGAPPAPSGQPNPERR